MDLHTGVYANEYTIKFQKLISGAALKYHGSTLARIPDPNRPAKALVKGKDVRIRYRYVEGTTESHDGEGKLEHMITV